MGWCEENGKRPALDKSFSFSGYGLLKDDREYWVWDVEPQDKSKPIEHHHLPHGVWLKLMKFTSYASRFASEDRAIDAANQAANMELAESQRCRPTLPLLHATAAKFSNHVRLATAGLDAS